MAKKTYMFDYEFLEKWASRVPPEAIRDFKLVVETLKEEAAYAVMEYSERNDT